MSVLARTSEKSRRSEKQETATRNWVHLLRARSDGREMEKKIVKTKQNSVNYRNNDNAGQPFNYARIKNEKCAVEAPNNGHLTFHRKCRPVVRLKHITTRES